MTTPTQTEKTGRTTPTQTKTGRYAVIRLDDDRVSGGPGTVIGYADTTLDYLQRFTDDGVRDPSLRLCRDAGIAVGRRVAHVED